MGGGGVLRPINTKYLDHLNQCGLYPLAPAMFPYYAHHPNSIFSLPSARIPSYPVRELMPLPMGSYPRGDVLLGGVPGSNIPINDVIPIAVHYGKDGLKASFQTIGYSPTELRVIAQYDHIEVMACKVDPLSGAVLKETRQRLAVPFPIVEYALQTGVEIDGTVVVYVPWRTY
ncbi:hypothetical protein M8J76_000668 [Diaphorina citri]|nr:hypothetical protein M8J75_004201 [Diaphorina citri]KAI5744265.1 hypothetical protein M8J76_000668 [Diaphorina citri]